MNNIVKRTLLVTGIVGLILALPKSALTEKNNAPVVQTQLRESEQLPKLLPVLTNTTNNASISVHTLSTKDAAIVQLNTEVNERSVDQAIAGIKQANKEQKNNLLIVGFSRWKCLRWWPTNRSYGSFEGSGIYSCHRTSC